MTIVTTLVPAIIFKGRGVGNTSRQIDWAVNELFKGHKVLVRDHTDDGNNEHGNKVLLNKIINRLETEHPRVGYHINKDDFSIELNSESKIIAWCPIITIDFLNTQVDSVRKLYDFVLGDYKVNVDNSKIFNILTTEGNIYWLKDRIYGLATHNNLKGTYIINYKPHYVE